MAPIQIIALLILIRLPAEMKMTPKLAAGEAFAMTRYQWIALGWFVGAQVLAAVYVWVRARGTIRELMQTSTSASSIASRFDALLPAARWATIAMTGVCLFLPHGMGLPQIVGPLIGQTRMLKYVPCLAEVLYVMPPLLAWVSFWTAQYFVEMAYRERTMPYRLASQLPAHEMPSLGAFLSMQMRHNLFVVFPLLVVGLISEAAERMERYWAMAPTLGVIATVGVFFLMTPWLITRIWATTPLTGELRMRLDGVAAEYRLRFRNILLWKTHNAMTNAAILGYLPFSRYFLMTDALLETLTDRQIEAVFAHEVGHGYHRHLWWYLTGFLSALCLGGAAAGLMALHLPMGVIDYLNGGAMEAKDVYDNTVILLSLVLMLPFVAFGFPWVSRRFEHQADWFAAKHMTKVVNAEALAAAVAGVEGSAGVAGGVVVLNPLAGAEVFGSSLDAIVELAHKSRDKRGWMHPSINSRIALLRELAVDAGARERFRRRMVVTRLALVGLAAVAVGVMVWAAVGTN